MKILFFSSYFYPYISGITTYPFKTLNHLAKKNKVTVLTFPHRNNLRKRELIDRLTVIRMPYFFQLSKGFISPTSFFIFLKEIRKTDLVILNIPNFEGIFLAVLAKIFNKKIISIFHCQVYLEKTLLNIIINFFLNFAVFVQLLLSNKIVAYTKDYFNSLFISKFFLKKTLFTLPPIEKFAVIKSKLNELNKIKGERIWLGYAGRIASEKGLEYLVQAIKSLPFSKNKIELVLAGPYGDEVAGENNYYLKIKKLLNDTEINYRFLGNLEKRDLGAFYRSIDVLCLPSINQTEAFGMVQAEAMISGTPVVASDLPGVRMPIKLTRMGILVEPGNSEKLLDAILKVLKNRHKYSNFDLVENAMKIFEIKKTYDLYDRLI